LHLARKSQKGLVPYFEGNYLLDFLIFDSSFGNSPVVFFDHSHLHINELLLHFVDNFDKSLNETHPFKITEARKIAVCSIISSKQTIFPQTSQVLDSKNKFCL